MSPTRLATGVGAHRFALVVGAAVLTLVAVLVVGGGEPQPAPEGIPDPGVLTGWALPALKLAQDLLALGVAGCALTPLLTMTTLREELDGVGYRALAWATRLGLLWLLATVALALFTVSDQFARPLWDMDAVSIVGYATQTPQGQAVLVQAIMLVVLVARTGLATRVSHAGWALALGLASALPPVFTGHSAASGSHDLAVVMLLAHVGIVLVWGGGIVALLWQLHERPNKRVRAAARFSPLAAWCLGITAVTGLISTLVRVGSLGELVGSPYGQISLLKLGVLVALGLTALRLRARFAAKAALGWIALVEVLLLVAAMAIGAGLSRTPIPVGEPYTTAAEAVLGGPMPPAPTLGRILFSFSPSGVGILVVGLGLVGYVVGVLTLRRRGDSWPIWRTAMWLLGLGVVYYATMGGVGSYSHVMFSVHMASHMLISMIAPIFLVLGAPVNLALRALPGADRPGGQGPRQILSSVLASRYTRILVNPVVAGVIFTGSLYGIYFTGAFEALMYNHLGHAFMQVHFLLAGLLFAEMLIGSAPIPHRPDHLVRVIVMLAVTPFHAFFSIAVMDAVRPIGEGFYAALDRPFATDLAADNYLGGGIAWASGEVPLVLLLLALVVQWFRSSQRQAQRFDRSEARKGEDANELAQYNAWLAQAAEAERRREERRSPSGPA
ncbi:cytochrome c oxidase assembly protein [Alteromonas gracilis]